MAAKAIICNLCNGQMQLYSGPRFSRKLGGVLIIGGIFAIFFWIGPVLGIPLLLMGLGFPAAALIGFLLVRVRRRS